MAYDCQKGETSVPVTITPGVDCSAASSISATLVAPDGSRTRSTLTGAWVSADSTLSFTIPEITVAGAWTIQGIVVFPDRRRLTTVGSFEAGPAL